MSKPAFADGMWLTSGGWKPDEIRSCAIIGQKLRQQGHRVRVVTHSIFKPLVTKLGLEFFSFSSSPEHPVAVSAPGIIQCSLASLIFSPEARHGFDAWLAKFKETGDFEIQ